MNKLRKAILEFDKSRGETGRDFVTGKITKQQADSEYEDDIAALLDAFKDVLPKEKEGINVYKEGTPDEFHSCLECGGYDECDCEGFNECIEQIKQLLMESKEV